MRLTKRDVEVFLIMRKRVCVFVVTVTLCLGVFAGSASAKLLVNYDFSLIELQQFNQLKSSSDKEQTSADNNFIPEKTTHQIQYGDTLFNISTRYDVKITDLRDWNNLSSDLIFIGETIAVKASAAKTNSSPKESDEQEYTMRATAYTAYCTGCSGITANGTDLRTYPNQKVIAVDPRVIPLGTKVWVEGYGEAIAADTGGAIKGNKIDVFIPTDGQARNWGVRTVTVKILN